MQFATKLAQQIVAVVEGHDSNAAYSYAMGMRYALELYMGVDAARELLFSLGHEY